MSPGSVSVSSTRRGSVVSRNDRNAKKQAGPGSVSPQPRPYATRRQNLMATHRRPKHHTPKRAQKLARRPRKNATTRATTARINELRSAHDRLGQTLLGLLDAIGAGI